MEISVRGASEVSCLELDTGTGSRVRFLSPPAEKSAGRDQLGLVGARKPA